MIRITFLFLLLFATLSSSRCRSPLVIPPPPSPPQTEVAERPDETKYVADSFVDGDSLSFNGYDVVKLKRKVKYDHMVVPIEVSFAVLKKNGRVIKTFDGTYKPMDHSSCFGLFPLLGAEQKQLVVSQTVFRWGRHWAVNLANLPEVIFDSKEYALGGEDFGVEDIDTNGVYEIFMFVSSFWGFHNMSMAESPRPTIIFKYDQSRRKYVIANVAYQDYLLKGIDSDIKQLTTNAEHYFSDRLKILLRYLYAGKENEGWSFFDKMYERPDKEESKRLIKKVLNREPAYKFIRRSA